MSNKYKTKLKFANSLIVIFQILLLYLCIFTILITLFPNLNPKSYELLGFWQVVSNKFSLLGFIDVVIFATLIPISIILIITYMKIGFTMKFHNSPISLLILLIFFNIFVLTIGLLDKPALFGNSLGYSLLYKSVPTINNKYSFLVNFNSYSIAAYIYWSIIGVFSFATIGMSINFLKVVLIPKKIIVSTQ